MPERRRTIALAQVAAHDLADAPVALAEALAAIETAADAGADLCVLPEGCYPGYVLGSEAAGRAVLARGPDPCATFAEAAAAAGIDVVAGLVLEGDGGLLNAAVHFDRRGAIRGRAAKRFLWHFDRAWFQPGGEAPVADGIGMLVCADGRLPEIAGGLAARGATLLVNSTAWVVSQPPPAGTNAQAEFMWRVRALETGCAAVACTKVGTEASVAMYAGKSQAVAPDGTLLALASSTEPQVVLSEVPIPEHAAPPVDRPLPARSPSPLAARPGAAYVAVVSSDDLVGALDGHGCRLIVGPSGIHALHDLSVALLHDDDLLVPGPCRAAAFDGAEVVVWLARSVRTPYVTEVARTRALENRVYVVVWRAVDEGGPFVVSPAGTVIARAPEGREHALGVSILPAEAATKEVAPGTDLFAGTLALGDGR